MTLHARTWIWTTRSYLRPKQLTWRDVVVSGLADCFARAGAGSSTEVPASAAKARDARAEETGAGRLGEGG